MLRTRLLWRGAPAEGRGPQLACLLHGSNHLSAGWVKISERRSRENQVEGLASLLGRDGFLEAMRPFFAISTLAPALARYLDYLLVHSHVLGQQDAPGEANRFRVFPTLRGHGGRAQEAR